MNCARAHDLLQQSLDGAWIESPEWLAHLRECADCRALASAGRCLQDGLRQRVAPLPPPDLGTRIVECMLRDRRTARRRVRRYCVAGFALAAGLLIALMLRFDWRRPTSAIQNLPTEPVTKNAPIPAEKPSPTLRESAAELGELFASLTNQTADETLGQTRYWVANVPSPALPKVELSTLETPTRPLREAGEGVSEGLEPVTTSARRAVGLFLRELPPMETEAKGL
jgi:hypothetical protein